MKEFAATWNIPFASTDLDAGIDQSRSRFDNLLWHHGCLSADLAHWSNRARRVRAFDMIHSRLRRFVTSFDS